MLLARHQKCVCQVDVHVKQPTLPIGQLWPPVQSIACFNLNKSGLGGTNWIDIRSNNCAKQSAEDLTNSRTIVHTYKYKEKSIESIELHCGKWNTLYSKPIMKIPVNIENWSLEYNIPIAQTECQQLWPITRIDHTKRTHACRTRACGLCSLKCEHPHIIIIIIIYMRSDICLRAHHTTTKQTATFACVRAYLWYSDFLWRRRRIQVQIQLYCWCIKHLFIFDCVSERARTLSARECVCERESYAFLLACSGLVVVGGLVMCWCGGGDVILSYIYIHFCIWMLCGRETPWRELYASNSDVHYERHIRVRRR